MNIQMQHREGAAGYSALVTAQPKDCLDVPLSRYRPMCCALLDGGDRQRCARGGVVLSYSPAAPQSDFHGKCSSRSNGRGNTRPMRVAARIGQRLPVGPWPRVPARACGPFSVGVADAHTRYGIIFPASLLSLHQQIEGDLGRFRVHFTAPNFADTVGVGAQTLDDIRKRVSLLRQNMHRYSLVLVETLALICDIIQRHAGDGVFRNCHGNFLSGGDGISSCLTRLLVQLVALYRGAGSIAGSGFLKPSRSGTPFYHIIRIVLPAYSARVFAVKNVLTLEAAEMFGFVVVSFKKFHVSFCELRKSFLEYLVNLASKISFEILLCFRVFQGGKPIGPSGSRIVSGDSGMRALAL